MIVHVALYFHGEILGRQHQAGLAIPVVQAPVPGLGVECAPGVLIKTHHKTHVVLAGPDCGVGGIKGATSGGTTVPDIGEL